MDIPFCLVLTEIEINKLDRFIKYRTTKRVLKTVIVSTRVLHTV